MLRHRTVSYLYLFVQVPARVPGAVGVAIEATKAAVTKIATKTKTVKRNLALDRATGGSAVDLGTDLDATTTARAAMTRNRVREETETTRKRKRRRNLA